MKIRTSFVTNSSSSSFIVVTEITNYEEAVKHIKEEFGKFGMKILEKDVVKGCPFEWEWDYFDDWDEEDKPKFDPDKHYIMSSYVEWSNDGETNSDNCVIVDSLPKQFKRKVCIIGGESTETEVFK